MSITHFRLPVESGRCGRDGSGGGADGHDAAPGTLVTVVTAVPGNSVTPGGGGLPPSEGRRNRFLESSGACLSRRHDPGTQSDRLDRTQVHSAGISRNRVSSIAWSEPTKRLKVAQDEIACARKLAGRSVGTSSTLRSRASTKRSAKRQAAAAVPGTSVRFAPSAPASAPRPPRCQAPRLRADDHVDLGEEMPAGLQTAFPIGKNPLNPRSPLMI